MTRKPNPDSYLLSTADFNQHVANMLDDIEKQIKTSKLDSYIPTAFLYLLEPQDAGKKMMVCLMPDFDVKRRYQLMDAFGAKVAKDGHLVMLFVFVAEAWRSVYKDQIPPNYPMPRDDPKRIESITIMASSVEGRMALAYLDVKRDKKNRMIPTDRLLIPYDDTDPNDAHSDLCDSFWQGYRQALRETIMSDPVGKAMIERLNKEASGNPPEAHNAKFN